VKEGKTALNIVKAQRQESQEDQDKGIGGHKSPRSPEIGEKVTACGKWEEKVRFQGTAVNKPIQIPCLNVVAYDFKKEEPFSTIVSTIREMGGDKGESKMTEIKRNRGDLKRKEQRCLRCFTSARRRQSGIMWGEKAFDANPRQRRACGSRRV